MAGMVNCNRCGGAFITLQELGLVKTNGELCPSCRTTEMENPAPPPPPDAPPWGVPTTPEVSAHDALEDLLGEVWKDEANWRLDDRINLAVRNEELKKKP